MAVLLPPIRQRFLDSNGKVLVGGKLWTYAAGTTTPKETYVDSYLTPNTNPIILDSEGYCDVWLKPGNYKFVLMDANDVVQYTVDNVKPADGGGGGLSDGDFAYDGFSARFNEQFTSTSLSETLDKIIKITYTPQTVGLSASSNILREKGTPVTATTLTASVTKKSNLIAEARFYKGATLLDTQTSGGAIPNGGNSTYDWTGSFSDNTTFSVQVDDASGGGGPTTVTASTTFSFVYPYYVGAGSSGISAASVASLTKRVIASTASRVETITATGGQVFYFAYPASYGALTSILDVNNFETLPDWTLRTENITGLDGNAVSYRIYEFNNPVAAGSYQYTFKR